MRTTIDLDEQTAKELARVKTLTREKQATVLRLAVRAGLPVVANRFGAERPEGHFEKAFGPNQERRALEQAMSRTNQRPERR
jgi:hypothetical protein